MIAVTSNFFRGSHVMMVFLMFSPLVMYSGSGCDVSCTNCFSSCTGCLDPHGKDSCDGATDPDACTEVVGVNCSGINCDFCVTNDSYDPDDKSQWVACPGSKTDCSVNSDKKNMMDIKNKIKIRKKSE